jgi:hypothetical protein
VPANVARNFSASRGGLTSTAPEIERPDDGRSLRSRSCRSLKRSGWTGYDRACQARLYDTVPHQNASGRPTAFRFKGQPWLKTTGCPFPQSLLDLYLLHFPSNFNICISLSPFSIWFASYQCRSIREVVRISCSLAVCYFVKALHRVWAKRWTTSASPR